MLVFLLVAALFGVLEGVTEWLPISSTGHLILLDLVLRLPLSAAAYELFEVVVQLGAMLAVAVIYRRRLFSLGKGERPATLALWGRVLLATLPAAAAGLLLDDLISERLHTPVVVATALIFYGVAFLWLGKWQKRHPSATLCENVSWRTAILIGCFQVLSLIPGTSRSGATILGGVLLGLSATAAAEFSFFLALPTMLGAGALKAVKFVAEGHTLTAAEGGVLLVGTAVAFLTSLAVIRFLTDFVKRHSFAPFGVYRILLGVAVLAASLWRTLS